MMIEEKISSKDWLDEANRMEDFAYELQDTLGKVTGKHYGNPAAFFTNDEKKSIQTLMCSLRDRARKMRSEGAK